MSYTPGFNSSSALLVDSIPCQWAPQDHGFSTWSIPPTEASSTYTLATGGTVYVVALKTHAQIVTNVVYRVTTAGSVLTSAQCLVGLYQGGTLLGTSADLHTVWGSTGLKTTALTSAVPVNQGIVYAAFVFNGTTGPTLSAGSTFGNENIGATVSRFGTADTGITTAFATTLGTISALAQSPFVALS